MRSITSEGMALIKRFEGFSATVYEDAAGHPTIGYGHLIRAGEDFAQGISPEQADALLRQDVKLAERAVLRLINVPLRDGQYDALVSFTFNLGAGALQRSRLRRMVNRQEDEAAALEFLRWVHAGGKRLNGLIIRRKAESERYLV